MHSRPPSTRTSPQRAALFVDYANLHTLLTERLDASSRAGNYITEAISELRRYLAEEDNTRTVLTAAYADFGVLHTEENLQQQLYQQGIEPRFVPDAPPGSPAEVQLSIDATALLHRRSDVSTFVLMTGDRTFLPLVQALRRQGAHVVVTALDPPPPDEHAHGDDDVFMDFLNLLSDDARRDLLQSGEMPARHPAPGSPGHASSPPAFDRLGDEVLFRTLEVAEEHFGQYEEVYLTPLLRKLSDVLGEEFDPKALVSDLEDAGAVRLEKRRGYPYDYTVLIVNREHPDVQKMEADFYGGEPSNYDSSDYESSDDYDDRGYHDASSEDTGSSSEHAFPHDQHDDEPVVDYDESSYDEPDAHDLDEQESY